MNKNTIPSKRKSLLALTVKKVRSKFTTKNDRTF